MAKARRKKKQREIISSLAFLSNPQSSYFIQNDGKSFEYFVVRGKSGAERSNGML
jgi:hypothetical protein